MSTDLNSKRVAALVIPFLAFSVLGVSAASAHFGQEATELSEEQRQTLQEARDLFRDGDTAAIKELIEEEDLPNELKERLKAHADRFAKAVAIREAVEKGDYDAFALLTKDASFASMVNEEFFGVFQKAYKLRMEGDIEGARAVMEEFGMEPHGRWGFNGHHGRGMWLHGPEEN